MINALLNYSFLQNALIAGLLAAVICGIIGVLITEKKMLMMSGGIAHTAYGGVGLGYLLGFEPIIGAGIFSVAAALTIGAVRRRGGVHTDVIISLLWALGMASGVAFVGFMPGYPPDMNSYLFGNILTVTKSDINAMLAMTVIVLFFVFMLYNDWKAFLFDENFSKSQGLKTGLLENLLLIIIALSIVSLIRVVGIILVIALLTAPAAAASLIAKTLKGRMLAAILLSAVFCTSGLMLSYVFGVPSGATIVFISVAAYFLVLLFSSLSARIKKRSVMKRY